MKGLPSSATPVALPDSVSWALVSRAEGCVSASDSFDSLASHCGTNKSEFSTLFAGTPPGRWPCFIGGRLLDVNIIHLSVEDFFLFAELISEQQASALLDSIRGKRRTLLCTPSGRLVAASSQAGEEFDSGGKTLQSRFDPGSRPTIQAGLNRCRTVGRVDDFLISTSTKGDRENWIISMETAPAPGGLIICDLSTPSLALVASGGVTDALLETIIEENPSPALMLDKTGIITKLNAAARSLAGEIHGETEVEGTYFWKWVAEEYREEAKANHDKRVRGYYAPNRYSLGLQTESPDDNLIMEVRVFPLAEGGNSVVFLSRAGDSEKDCLIGSKADDILAASFADPCNPTSLISILRAFTGAQSLAMILPEQTFTSGDTTTLLENSPAGVQGTEWDEAHGEWRVFHSFTSGGEAMMIALGGLRRKGMMPCGKMALRFTQKCMEDSGHAGESGKTRALMEQVSRLIGLVRMGRDGTESILREIAGICSAEKVVKAELSSDGSMLLPVSSFGIQGSLPGYSLGSDSILTWVCVHGKSAFLADPMNDVRMSAVFPDSDSEIAAPIMRGEIVTGALLLATSVQDGFHGKSLMLLEAAVEILSSMDSSHRTGRAEPRSGTVSDELAESAILGLEHTLSASAASLTSALEQLADPVSADRTETMDLIRESVASIASTTSNLTGWLRASAYGGRPDMKWSDPCDTVSDVLSEHRKSPGVRGIHLNLETPGEAFIACFDPAWLSLTLNCILRTALEHTEPGGVIGVSLASGNDFWTVEVKNSGRGIPASDIPDLFRKSGEKPATGVRSVSGLDMPLAKNLTEAMGGTIAVFSSRNSGTRFVLRFSSS